MAPKTRTVTADAATSTFPNFLHQLVRVGDYVFGCVRRDGTVPDATRLSFVRVHAETYAQSTLRCEYAGDPKPFQDFNEFIWVPSRGKLYALGGHRDKNVVALIEIDPGLDGSPMTYTYRVVDTTWRFGGLEESFSPSADLNTTGGNIFFDGTYFYAWHTNMLWKIDSRDWSYVKTAAHIYRYASDFNVGDVYQHSMASDVVNGVGFLYVGWQSNASLGATSHRRGPFMRIDAATLSSSTAIKMWAPRTTGPNPNVHDAEYVYGATEVNATALDGWYTNAQVWALKKSDLSFRYLADAPAAPRQLPDSTISTMAAGCYKWGDYLVLMHPDYVQTPGVRIVLVPVSTAPQWAQGAAWQAGYHYLEFAERVITLTLPESLTAQGIVRVNDAAQDALGRWHVSAFKATGDSGCAIMRFPNLFADTVASFRARRKRGAVVSAWSPVLLVNANMPQEIIAEAVTVGELRADSLHYRPQDHVVEAVLVQEGSADLAGLREERTESAAAIEAATDEYVAVPVVPVITFPETGAVQSGTTLTVQGTATALSVVDVYVDDALDGSATANGVGSWAYTTGTKAAGAHNVKAKAQSGNPPEFSNVVSITLSVSGALGAKTLHNRYSLLAFKHLKTPVSAHIAKAVKQDANHYGWVNITSNSWQAYRYAPGIFSADDAKAIIYEWFKSTQVAYGNPGTNWVGNSYFGTLEGIPAIYLNATSRFVYFPTDDAPILDQGCFATSFLAMLVELGDTSAWATYKDLAWYGLEWAPRDTDGLIYDGGHPECWESSGTEDIMGVQGRVSMPSIIHAATYNTYARLAEQMGDTAARDLAISRRDAMKAALKSSGLWKADGYFAPSNEESTKHAIRHVTFAWGGGVISGTDADTVAATVLADYNAGLLTQRGLMRINLRYPEVYDNTTVPVNQYQNGGYWFAGVMALADIVGHADVTKGSEIRQNGLREMMRQFRSSNPDSQYQNDPVEWLNVLNGGNSPSREYTDDITEVCKLADTTPAEMQIDLTSAGGWLGELWARDSHATTKVVVECDVASTCTVEVWAEALQNTLMEALDVPEKLSMGQLLAVVSLTGETTKATGIGEVFPSACYGGKLFAKVVAGTPAGPLRVKLRQGEFAATYPQIQAYAPGTATVRHSDTFATNTLSRYEVSPLSTLEEGKDGPYWTPGWFHETDHFAYTDGNYGFLAARAYAHNPDTYIEADVNVSPDCSRHAGLILRCDTRSGPVVPANGIIAGFRKSGASFVMEIKAYVNGSLYTTTSAALSSSPAGTWARLAFDAATRTLTWVNKPGGAQSLVLSANVMPVHANASGVGMLAGSGTAQFKNLSISRAALRQPVPPWHHVTQQNVEAAEGLGFEVSASSEALDTIGAAGKTYALRNHQGTSRGTVTAAKAACVY